MGMIVGPSFPRAAYRPSMEISVAGPSAEMGTADWSRPPSIEMTALGEVRRPQPHPQPVRHTTRPQIPTPTPTGTSRITSTGTGPLWDRLSAKNKINSVNAHNTWKFQDKSAWNPAGVVQEMWSSTIYPHILKPFLRDNERAIFKDMKRRPPYNVVCWMVGKDEKSACPAVIFVCSDEKAVKRAVGLIGRCEGLKRYGFRAYGYGKA